MNTIFDEIRVRTSEVAESARWVRVNEEELNLYPEKLGLGEVSELNHTPEHHLLGQGEDTLRFFVLLDTINFGSGYFPFLDKDSGVSGYFTVARRLKEYVQSSGVPSADYLQRIRPIDCAKMLRQDIYNKHMEELMELFALALRVLGGWVVEKYSGDYLGFLKSSDSADQAVKKLSQMLPFDDRANYFGVSIPFYKRAQILLQDMQMAEPNSPLLDFPDFDDLTVFADNILPYVFRQDGLLELDPWLEKRISEEQLIASGSAEEIELRACSVYIGERVAELVREDLRPISVRELDFRIWNRGQKLKKYSDEKRHRTRCIYY